MKTLYSLLIVVLTTFFSCSSNDDVSNNNENESKWLPKAVQDKDGKILYQYIYIENNKLKEIKTNGNSRYEFTYSGNNIIQLDSYPESKWHELTEKFEYNSNGKIKKYTIVYYDVETWIEEYEYLSQNEIKVTHYAKSKPNDISYSTKILDNHGRLIKDVHSNGNTTSYEYDNKNAFNKNIQGLDKLNIVYGHYSGPYHSAINNLIKVIDEGSFPETEIYNYDYNLENYPITTYGTDPNEKGYFTYY